MIIEVAKHPDETVNFGGIWHSDTTYLDEPPMASMLVAREVPPVGGDTMFSNQYAAYEALPEKMKETLVDSAAFRLPRLLTCRRPVRTVEVMPPTAGTPRPPMSSKPFIPPSGRTQRRAAGRSTSTSPTLLDSTE